MDRRSVGVAPQIAASPRSAGDLAVTIAAHRDPAQPIAFSNSRHTQHTKPPTDQVRAFMYGVGTCEQPEGPSGSVGSEEHSARALVHGIHWELASHTHMNSMCATVKVRYQKLSSLPRSMFFSSFSMLAQQHTEVMLSRCCQGSCCPCHAAVLAGMP